MGKQYTTAPILVNSNGDPIPQYLDITDKTDSPQGTFKPLTNETIQKVQLTGSNAEKLFYGAVTKTRVVAINGGVQFDGGTTSAPPVQPDEVRNVLSVAGTGQGIMLRFISRVIKDRVGFTIKMDNTTIANEFSGDPTGRLMSLQSFERAGLTSVGDTLGFARIARWDENDPSYIVEIDLAKLGTFQENMSVAMVNGDIDPARMSILVIYEALASPEVKVLSKKEVEPNFIRAELARKKYGDIQDFTVIKQLIQDEEDTEITYEYIIFYRDGIETEIESFLNSILN